jgi:hypothetical protein
MYKTILTLTSSFILLSINDVKAQGCSDAGVCSMGNIESNHTYIKDSTKNTYSIRIGQGFGLGEQSVINALTNIDLSANFNKFYLQLKIPYAYNSGNLGQVNGFSDISLSASYTIKNTQKHTYGVVLGFKIPTNQADIKLGNGIAPMPYQTSLGTYDLILGTNLKLDKYVFALAYLHVLKHNNRNQFIASDFTNADNYFSSFLFKRSNDVVLRVERRIDFKNNWSINPSTLFIYRLRNDQEADVGGNYSEIKNSNGLTFNAVVNINKKFKNENAIDLSFAFPLVVRDVRPDGLTRSAIISAAYKFNL